MTIAELYKGAEPFINALLRKEFVAQGHHLDGSWEDSLGAKITSNSKSSDMEGFAAYYTRFVDQGIPSASASFKQFPFLVQYFTKRLGSVIDARRVAAATIRTWMKEGMSTQASKRFSETGSRQNFIENAFVGASDKIDEYMGNGLDYVVEEKFQMEKSETI